MSVNSTSPSTLFGGTWQRIQDRFLIAAGSTYKAGGTGGEATHTLTVNEMPSHSHTVGYEGSNSGGGKNHSVVSGSEIRTSSTGGGQSHNNMPPYLSVYVWKRTA